MIVEVGPVAHGGHCVARDSGRVIFVRHALPGERVRIEVTSQKKSFWTADAIEILRASPDRVTPPCRYAGSCGGCDFQHVSADGQLALKTSVLREQLCRLGGLSEKDVSEYNVEALPGGLLGWRTRMQYAVAKDGTAGLHRHHSREVVDIDTCILAQQSIRDTDVLDRNWKGSNVVGVVASSEDPVSIFTQRDRRGSKRMVAGPATISETQGGHRFTLAAEAFWQVHPATAMTLADTVADMLMPKAGEIVWDLYAGAGLFAAVLCDEVTTAGKVVAVESAEAGHPAENLKDFPQSEVIRARVEDVVADLPSPDVVVLDPPRSGAGKAVVAAISAASPRAIAYVACDPAALGRDVQTFREHGYRLAGIRAFDAFPMTHHFESVALFVAQ